MSGEANILIIEDNDTMREALKQAIKKMGSNPICAENGIDGVNLFSKLKCDFVITDLKMDNMDGIQVLEKIKELDQDAIVMLITGYGTIDTAVSAMKKGAFDFITKPFSNDVLRVKVEQALRVKKLGDENIRLKELNQIFRENEDEKYNFNEIIGNSPSLLNILEVIKKVSQTDSAVLITGESGVGKELIARAIHFNSQRKDKPFIKVNCGALAEGVLESELFGHEKGSFTGAIRKKIGRFELADTGTIFLDEVGDFTPNIQIKMLRVLQEKEFERVGGAQTVKVNVRIISATNKDLYKEIKEGRFREDLFYRLHIVPIHVTPLRERQDDIQTLAQFFINKLNKSIGKNITGFTSRAISVLKKYPWPGNVRELENIVEQAYVLTVHKEIDVEDLPMFIQDSQTHDFARFSDNNEDLTTILERIEKNLIERALRKANGVKTETARILGLKTSALYYKLEKYGFITQAEKENIKENYNE
jgi:two-component system response regulator HydG